MCSSKENLVFSAYKKNYKCIAIRKEYPCNVCLSVYNFLCSHEQMDLDGQTISRTLLDMKTGRISKRRKK